MYKHHWTPSKSARREFAIKMQTDKEFADAYNQRKEAKKEKFLKSIEETGQKSYVPTQAQHDFCVFERPGFLTDEQEDACNFVAFAFACNEKVDHYYIHIVNELRRKFL